MRAVLNLTTTLIFLLRWAFYRTVRTKNTAVAFLRLQPCFAVAAIIEELASINWHFFFFLKSTGRAFNGRFKYHDKRLLQLLQKQQDRNERIGGKDADSIDDDRKPKHPSREDDRHRVFRIQCSHFETP